MSLQGAAHAPKGAAPHSSPDAPPSSHRDILSLHAKGGEGNAAGKLQQLSATCRRRRRLLARPPWTPRRPHCTQRRGACRQRSAMKRRRTGGPRQQRPAPLLSPRPASPRPRWEEGLLWRWTARQDEPQGRRREASSTSAVPALPTSGEEQRAPMSPVAGAAPDDGLQALGKARRREEEERQPGRPPHRRPPARSQVQPPAPSPRPRVTPPAPHWVVGRSAACASPSHGGPA